MQDSQQPVGLAEEPAVGFEREGVVRGLEHRDQRPFREGERRADRLHLVQL